MVKPSCKYLSHFNDRVNVLNISLRISLALIHISSHLNKTLHREEFLNLHMTFLTCEYNEGCLRDLRLRRMEPANTSTWYIALMPHAVSGGRHTFCYSLYCITSKKII